jgi:hypothetical protein
MMPKGKKDSFTRTKSPEWVLGNCTRCPRCELVQHLDWPTKVYKCTAFTPPKMLANASFNWHSCPVRLKLPRPWCKYPAGSLLDAVQKGEIPLEALLS